jgi:hypothetical protein
LFPVLDKVENEQQINERKDQYFTNLRIHFDQVLQAQATSQDNILFIFDEARCLLQLAKGSQVSNFVILRRALQKFSSL